MTFAASVILPVYLPTASIADFRLLQRAIESVLDQRFPDAFEVLLVDDGSPTPIASLSEFIGTLERPNVRCIRYEQNRGLVYALNTGLNQARYPFIARIDADDRWRDGKIEKQFALFAADPDLSIVGTGMTMTAPNGEIVGETIRPAPWSDLLRFFVEVGCPFPHGSVLARRDIYRLMGGYPHDLTYAHCEDYALWGQWLRFFKPSMIEELLYDYTVSQGSISAVHATQQANASRLVNLRFAELDLITRLPAALTDLASLLDLSLLQAGVLAFRMWKYHTPVRLPDDAAECLQVILCDKLVTPADDSRAGLSLRDALRGFHAAGAEVADYDGTITVRAA
jgi:glycosyltransferase involved in cell wall biosynthesis